MQVKLAAVFVILVSLVGASPTSAQLKRVRFSTTGVSISEMPFKVAQVKGFWREEGLDVETILIRGAVGMQALLGGSVDYTSASGSTIAAAVRGLPVKLVFISSSKPQFELISQPQIKSVQELKGKIIGISSRGGSNDLMMQLILQKNGLAPNKDVTTLIVGAQAETVIALRTGRIAAALLTPPRNFMLQRDGYNRIAYSGDYMPTYANGGIGITDEKIKTNPAEVLALVRGTIKGLQYSMKNRAEMIKIMPDYLGIKDPSLIDQLYDLYVTRQSVDGSVDENWMKGAIEFTQKTLGGPAKEIPPSQVFDFSFVQRAAR
ncbi:MAG TPA: ABC transporter substrate-binding protein [Candidatus Binatia bacterium]|nr:ABC transporter substrate-binding protein [Candidatus Binatia bacterium]